MDFLSDIKLKISTVAVIIGTVVVPAVSLWKVNELKVQVLDVTVQTVQKEQREIRDSIVRELSQLRETINESNMRIARLEGRLGGSSAIGGGKR